MLVCNHMDQTKSGSGESFRLMVSNWLTDVRRRGADLYAMNDGDEIQYLSFEGKDHFRFSVEIDYALQEITVQITDPKTTTHSKKGQMLVAFLVATMESALRLWAPLNPATAHFAIHAPYYALTVMGPVSNLIEIYLQAKAKRAKQKESATGTLFSLCLDG